MRPTYPAGDDSAQLPGASEDRLDIQQVMLTFVDGMMAKPGHVSDSRLGIVVDAGTPYATAYRNTFWSPDPQVISGLPCIRGLRIPVATVVAMVADGMSVDEVMAELPDLTREDVAEALHYAADAVRERELPLRRPA